MDTVKHHGEVISRDQLQQISQRYHRITKAVNLEFWNSSSEIAHSLYVGSYGRGTAIDSSDIDILVELPREEYNRYDAHKGNGQSRLLQAVKSAIQTTYPNSDIRADGQVVVIRFSDGMKFEILPAFAKVDWLGNLTGKYDYPDSNMGGNWRTTDPKAEQEAMREKNRASNGLLYDTCKHMRQIRDTYFSSYKLPGIVIDSFVYQYMGGWYWPTPGETSTQPTGSYEKNLYNTCPSYTINLYAPGSGMSVDATDYLDVLNKVLNYMSKE